MKESYSVLGTVQYPHPYPSSPLQNANLTSKGTYYLQLQCIWCCPRDLISALSLLLSARERKKMQHPDPSCLEIYGEKYL
jgi:hypothetical protein